MSKSVVFLPLILILRSQHLWKWLASGRNIALLRSQHYYPPVGTCIYKSTSYFHPWKHTLIRQTYLIKAYNYFHRVLNYKLTNSHQNSMSSKAHFYLFSKSMCLPRADRCCARKIMLGAEEFYTNDYLLLPKNWALVITNLHRMCWKSVIQID